MLKTIKKVISYILVIILIISLGIFIGIKIEKYEIEKKERKEYSNFDMKVVGLQEGRAGVNNGTTSYSIILQVIKYIVLKG